MLLALFNFQACVVLHFGPQCLDATHMMLDDRLKWAALHNKYLVQLQLFRVLQQIHVQGLCITYLRHAKYDWKRMHNKQMCLKTTKLQNTILEVV